MPFIVNDSEWKLIAEDEPYDKEQFAVVKELHFKLNTTETALVRIEFNVNFSLNRIYLHQFLNRSLFLLFLSQLNNFRRIKFVSKFVNLVVFDPSKCCRTIQRTCHSPTIESHIWSNYNTTWTR